MTDVFDPEKRREVMKLVKSKNSKAELIVFRYLRKQGIYFQKHYKKASGRPDIALPRKKKAVFIDGDFWHGRDIERRLRGRGVDDYWVKKIKRNAERDEEQRQVLEDEGWQVLRIWESDINRKRTQDESLNRIKNFLVN